MLHEAPRLSFEVGYGVDDLHRIELLGSVRVVGSGGWVGEYVGEKGFERGGSIIVP